MSLLHLVGGFLGSGKTTAIAEAAKQLMARGLRVGVVTNDQGRYLVDTAFFALQDMPTVEVSGGCFCCGYDDLTARLAELRDNARPEVIFAESVGSCADLVATVVRPLLELRNIDMPPTSFSVFADARLLLRRLRGEPLPFSDNVVYLFDQQREEAGLLVVNKSDLLNPEQRDELVSLLGKHYAKPWRLQSSLQAADVAGWLEIIETPGAALSGSALDIDYARYGDGEMRLAWLDEVLQVRVAAGPVRPAVEAVIERIMAALRAETPAIAHVKFVVGDAEAEAKISFTANDERDWRSELPVLASSASDLLLNARVELPAERLEALVNGALQGLPFEITVASSSAFHPKQPAPQVRIV